MPRIGLVLVALLSSVSVGGAQTSAADDQLRKDIEVLKEGQRSIQKDLEDIKRLLQSRTAADPIPEAPMNIANEPFRGSQRAKDASPDRE